LSHRFLNGKNHAELTLVTSGRRNQGNEAIHPEGGSGSVFDPVFWMQIRLITLMRIRIRLFTLMRMRIRIQILVSKY